MWLEDSYLSRFFTKFVEIVAGGLATAMCAYLIAHVGGPLSSATPAPTAVSAASATGEVAAGLPAQLAPPVTAAAVEAQHRATQPVTDAPPPAQPARKAEKAAMAVPAPKDNKASASPARSEKSAEALARAALANLDADRPAPADAPIRRNLTGTGTAASSSSNAPPTCRRARPTSSRPLPLSMPRSGMSPPSTRRPRTPVRRRKSHLLGRSLNLTRTKGSSRFLNECPICCAPARPRSPAKPPVHPCRSERHRVNSGEVARPTVHESWRFYFSALSPVSASNRAPASLPRRSAPRSSGARPARGPARRPDCRSPPG